MASDINEGRYTPGDKLPTEAALARRFGVNRHTIRRALGDLAKTGAVYSRRGSGVFVQKAQTEYPLGRRVSFTQNLRAAGRLPSRQILLIETRNADARESEVLGLDPGETVHSYDGLSFADNQPIAVFRSVFPGRFLPGLSDAILRYESITLALRDQGVKDFAREWTHVSAHAASATQALHLRLSVGAPLIQTLSLNTDPDGHPIEYGCTWFSGDAVTLTFNREEEIGRYTKSD